MNTPITLTPSQEAALEGEIRPRDLADLKAMKREATRHIWNHPTEGEGLMNTNITQAAAEHEQQMLQADLALGRQLAAAMKEGQPASFLRDLRISKTRAYALMQLASTADELLDRDLITNRALQRFTAKSLQALGCASPDVQLQVCDAAMEGQVITTKGIQELEAKAASDSHLLPQAVRDGVKAGYLPAKTVADLANHLSGLNPAFVKAVCRDLPGAPSLQNIREATTIARALIRGLEASARLQGINGITLEGAGQALLQSVKADATRLLVDALKAAEDIAAAQRKLLAAQKRLQSALRPLVEETPAGTEMHRVVLALQSMEEQE